MNKLKRFIKANPIPTIGICIILFFVAVAVFAPFIAPFDPHERVGKPYQLPCDEFILGTNDIGQDIFSEMIYGTRVSLSIGIIAALATMIIGTFLGIVSGFFGGITDKIVLAVISTIMCLPSLPLTLVLVTILGSGYVNLVIMLCLTSWAGTAKVIRSTIFSMKKQAYIMIAPSLGIPTRHTIIKYIVPNLKEILITRFALSVGSAIIVESSLSFLGIHVGFAKSWGNVLHHAYSGSGIINNYYWWYAPPIICISLCMIGFMLFAQLNSKRFGVANGG